MSTEGHPNIVFILGDDIGWSDFSYNVVNPVIPTPNIDALAQKGVQLKQLYTHSLCTPSRAALLTGRYHINTGLTYVLTPGTPAGLPDNIATLPTVLKDVGNYSTSMVGKWHLGHCQRKQTPTGKGFESFTGYYMWDVDSYTKQMYEAPWSPAMMIDWVSEYNNGTFHHYAEPEHATLAITREAKQVISSHVANGKKSPLFLYVAYTAAHSPLQPLPQHIEKCSHIPHLWRRQFCGMVVGFDEGVKNITDHVRQVLGENSIVVVTSDNGGSPWFGGMNAPLRGSKATPYEGGTRVPGLIVDLSDDQRYLPRSGPKTLSVREFHGLMHFSDWLPTLLGFAGVDKSKYPNKIDGLDISQSLKQSETNPSDSPRDEMLLEMYYPEEFLFKQGLVSYRIGDYKLIKGIVRDSNYYRESFADHLNISGASLLTRFTENLNRLGDYIYGNNRFDGLRISITHAIMQDVMTHDQHVGKEETNRLYNIKTDPYESVNLYYEPWAKPIIERIEGRLNHYNATRPKPQKAFIQSHLVNSWPKTLVAGDCSMNPTLHPEECRFTHPWVSDDADPWQQPGLIDSMDYLHGRIHDVFVKHAVLRLFIVVSLFFIFRWARRSLRVKKESSSSKKYE